MSNTTQLPPPPTGQPYGPPPPSGEPGRPKRSKKHLIGYTATGLVALGIGAASGGGGNAPATPTAASAAVTATVTVPGAPGDAVTVTAPPVTVTKTVTVNKTVAPAAKASFPGDGTYQVGVDIKAGTYVSSKPDSGNCYWARLKDDAGGFDSIIANNNSSGQSVVTIRRTDKFFETSGCSDWKMR